MAMLGEKKALKLSSFVFKKQLPADALTEEEKAVINQIFGKIVKEWPCDMNTMHGLGLLTGYAFYEEFFQPVLQRSYNVACNGLSTSQDKAVYQESEVILIVDFYLHKFCSWVD